MRRSVLAALIGAAATRSALGQAGARSTAMRIRFAFDGRALLAALDDNPTARDLLSLLPLDLSIDDFSTNEKIAYLPRKLSEQGSGPFTNEAAGDLCYYAPWGNLALFHAGYHWSSGLIRLGRLQGDLAPLRVRGKFPLRVERTS